MSPNDSLLEPTCHRRLLASGQGVLVEECTCGAIHVTVGATTTRFAPNAAAELAATVALALQRRRLAALGQSDKLLACS